MSFWEDLSPGVKRYAIVAVVLLIALIGYRACSSSGTESKTLPPRGIVR